jgi:hypothetical protein
MIFENNPLIPRYTEPKTWTNIVLDTKVIKIYKH